MLDLLLLFFFFGCCWVFGSVPHFGYNVSSYVFMLVVKYELGGRTMVVVLFKCYYELSVVIFYVIMN